MTAQRVEFVNLSTLRCANGTLLPAYLNLKTLRAYISHENVNMKPFQRSSSQDVVPLLSQQLGSEHIYTRLIEANYGCSLAGQEKWEAAIPLLEGCIAGLGSLTGRTDPCCVAAIEQLGMWRRM